MSLNILKKVLATLFLGAFIVLGAGAYCAKSSNPSSSASVSTNAVSIKNTSFNPPNITVSPGTTVTWTNNDSITHTVTSNDNKFNMTLNPGQTFSFTFSDAGTFAYHCSIHASMTGQVVVK